MAAPRQPVNGAGTSVGFTAKLVTVQSISPDGTTAVCVDRQNTQVNVPMLIQQSKGVLPAVGETWMVTQNLGMWTFSAIVAQSAGQFQPANPGSGVYTQATAPGNPSVGELWVNTAISNMLTVWNGTEWLPVQFGATAIQTGSLTSQQLAEDANIAASQVNFTASDIGGVTTTISATQPSDPSFGDLWYDAGNGYQLKQWTGTTWTAYQWGTQAIEARSVTTQLLAAEAVTANEMAAGIIYGGIIDGTIVNAATFIGSTFEGTDFILNDAGAFWYSSTPGLGNLFVNITSQGGTDGLGNTYPAGVFIYGPSGSVLGLIDNGSNAAMILGPAGQVNVTIPAQVFSQSQNPGAANEQVWLVLTSGKESGLADAAIQLMSESNDGTISPVMVFEFGGAIAVTLTQNGFVSGDSWHSASLINGWSGSGVGANGLFYQRTADAQVRVIGDIINSSATGNSTCFTLPAGYHPGTAQNRPASWNNPASSNSATTPWVAVNTSGDVVIAGIEVANRQIFFDVSLPLAAL
jgi:hypothetical protein